MGRWLDVAGTPDNPLQGLTLGGGLSPTLRTSGAPVASLNSPRDARLNFAGTWGVGADITAQAWGRLADSASKSRPGPAAAAKSAQLARTVATKLAPYEPQDNGPDPLAPPIPYPEDNDPDVSRLDEHGNLAVTVDFRRVYASLLEGWLGTPADAVLPGAASFGCVALVS